MLQIIVHSTMIFEKSKCSLDQEMLSQVLQNSMDIVSLINEFQTLSGSSDSNGKTYNDLCFQVSQYIYEIKLLFFI